MQYTKRLLPAAALMFALPAAPGGEIAVLKTGYRLRVARHERRARACGCLRPAGGKLELPASAVVRFEPDGAAPERPAVQQRPAAEKTAAGKPLSVAAAVDRFAAEAGLPAELIHAVVAEESLTAPTPFPRRERSARCS